MKLFCYCHKSEMSTSKFDRQIVSTISFIIIYWELNKLYKNPKYAYSFFSSNRKQFVRCFLLDGIRKFACFLLNGHRNVSYYTEIYEKFVVSY